MTHKAIKFRAAFGYDVEEASHEASIDFKGEHSLTIQSMAEDADINVLMERYGITGTMPINPRVPMYGDFTEVTDYRSALHAVMEASDAFMELPAKIRARFNNDPQELLDFCANDANINEARSLGLLKEIGNGQSVTSRGPGAPVPAEGGPAREGAAGVEVPAGGRTAASRGGAETA